MLILVETTCSIMCCFIVVRSERQWQKRYAQWEKEELARPETQEKRVSSQHRVQVG